MKISVDVQLTNDEESELAEILSCKKTDLRDELTGYAAAAIVEYVSMFQGKRVFTRGSDIMEYRLLLLIERAFEGRVPDEVEVSKLFQLTSNAARALIRAVMSKYQYQLKDAITETIRRLLQSAEIERQGQPATIAVHNLTLVDELNRTLANEDTNHTPVSKVRGSVSTYELIPSSYNALCTFYGVTPQKPTHG